MSIEHKVKQGEDISSIAEKYGLFPEKIWNDPANAELKEKRKEQDILFPGDVVTIPDKQEKEETGSTEERHRFRRKGVPIKFCMTVKVGDKPRADESYILEIDGQLFSGTTDKEGRLEYKISPNARQGKLIIGEGDDQDEIPLKLGYIDPVTKISGVQARLNSLGFECGEIGGILNDYTIEALKLFQGKHDLPMTGEPDEATRNKLIEEHGC